MAAHIEGLGAGIIDMAGLAQKGGAVLSHIKIAPRREDVTTIRVGPGDASTVLACDIAVAGSSKVLAAIAPGALVVANTHEQLPGDFTREPDYSLPVRRILSALRERADTIAFDATRAATALFGDAIAANMMVMGAACQRGAIPVSAASLEAAIRLNGAAVEMNLGAFRAGRLSVADPARFAALLAGTNPAPLPHRVLPETLEERIARYRDSLCAYQSARWAARFEARVEAVRAAAERAGADPAPLVRAVADGLYRLMSVKDEYEVARLFVDGGFAEQLRAQFGSWRSLEFHMAPPLLSRTDPATGRPRKRAFGPWLMKVLPLLARMRRLRGTPLDVFGYTAERRGERALLAAYEATVDHIAATITADRIDAAVALANWPAGVKGYGPVREENTRRARAEAEALRAAYDAAPVRTLEAAE